MSEEYSYITEEEIARRAASIGRQCGQCSLCCLLLNVPEVGKEDKKYCPHCRPGKGGCSIYSTRPERCRRYTCAWLVNQKLPDYWYPAQSQMIVDFQISDDGDASMRIHVHPDCPQRWREEPYCTDIARWAHWGQNGSKRKYRVVIIADGINDEPAAAAAE